MPKKTAQTLTRVYELVVTFTARDQRLFWHVEEKDRVRLLKVFDDRTEHRLYELGGSEGLECLVNTAHIRRINVLDYVGGIEFEAETELTEKESLKKLQERETSDEPVIVRLWLRGCHWRIHAHGRPHTRRNRPVHRLTRVLRRYCARTGSPYAPDRARLRVRHGRCNSFGAATERVFRIRARIPSSLLEPGSRSHRSWQILRRRYACRSSSEKREAGVGPAREAAPSPRN